MDFFKVISEKECVNVIKNNLTRGVVSFHKEKLIDSLGKTIATDVVSKSILPLYDRSTVDGYAINAQDAYCASSSIPTFLNVVDKIPIGQMPKCKINKGECAYVATGALIPEGATGVVMIENVEELNGKVAVYSPIKPFENIVKKGEEIQEGDIVAHKGDKVTPILIGVLSSIGISEINVYDKITVSIISTGDELTDNESDVKDGKIRDINTNLLYSYCLSYGYDVVNTIKVKDNKDEIKAAINKCIESSSIVLLSGGSSVGAKDFTLDIFNELGKVLVHGLALKPGKPTVIGSIDEKLVIGLPGNPYAAMFVLKTILFDVISSLMGEIIKPMCIAKCKMNFHSTPGRLTLQPVKFVYENDELYCEPIFLKSAHFASMLKADGYVKIDQDSEGVNVNDKIEVYSLFCK